MKMHLEALKASVAGGRDIDVGKAGEGDILAGSEKMKIETGRTVLWKILLKDVFGESPDPRLFIGRDVQFELFFRKIRDP
jgi:hypothetical protein